jgi:hypothetical protein
MIDDSNKPDDKKLKSNSSSGATEDEEEYRKLLAALLKKMEILDAVGERLTRLEAGQEAILHHRAPEILRNRKEGPMETTRFHKLDFPTFDGGSDPLPFLSHCEHYFCSQRTAEEERVWLAAFHLQGLAQQWYMRLQHEGTPT